jgi:hypothetical protein
MRKASVCHSGGAREGPFRLHGIESMQLPSQPRAGRSEAWLYGRNERPNTDAIGGQPLACQYTTYHPLMLAVKTDMA